MPADFHFRRSLDLTYLPCLYKVHPVDSILSLMIDVARKAGMSDPNSLQKMLFSEVLGLRFASKGLKIPTSPI